MNKFVNSICLELFRILLGFCLVFETFRLYKILQSYYINPEFLFKFPLFEFVKPFPFPILLAILTSMFLASCGILLKVFYKVSLVIFLVFYSYFFLLDCSHYNNHYYLVILILFLLVIIPQNGNLRTFIKTNEAPTASLWGIWVLRFQILVVYFYGGIAKLHFDWINGDVMNAVFNQNPNQIPFFFPFSIENSVLLYTYGGIIIDLFVAPLLLMKKTRWLAFFVLVAFHLSNAYSLNIGIFPYFMIAACILFWNGDQLQSLLKRPKVKTSENPFARESSISIYNQMYPILLSSYIGFQLLFPLRHYLISNNVDWTGQGKFFSWRMKMPHKSLEQFEIFTFDKKTGEEYKPNINITGEQLNAFVYYPTLLPQFLDALVEKIDGKQKEDIQFKLNVKVSMNGKNAQTVYSQSYNFSDAELELFKDNKWITVLGN